MKSDSLYRLLWVVFFGISMGYFEASVVVYMREIFYPDGFRFPLLSYEETDLRILWVELGREVMSVLMLVSVGMLAGRRGLERAFFFICGFGVWDVFYYIFLKLTLGWPESLATWDILFLIPLPWVGPVWAPALIAVLFVVYTVLFLIQEDNGRPMHFVALEWVLAIGGSLCIIVGFCLDGVHVMRGGYPHPFPWGYWLVGVLAGSGAFFLALRRSRREGRALDHEAMASQKKTPSAG